MGIEFELAENTGRSKALKALESVHFSDSDYKIIPTKNECKWDFEIRENSNNRLLAIVEAKDRKFSSWSVKVRDKGVQLEDGKYYTMKTMGNRKNIPAYYLATFTDNKFYMWDLNTAPSTEDDRYCNRTTAVKSEKVLKHCFYFKKEDSVFSGNI